MNIGDMLFGAEEKSVSTVIVESPITVVKAKKPRATKKEDVEPVEKPVYNTYEDFDYEELLTYAGIDTYGTSKAVAKMFPKLIEQPEYKISDGPGRTKTTRAPALLDVYQDCTQVIFDFICDLELAGINYDQEANRRLDKEMREEVAQLEDAIFSDIGKKINLNSGDVLSNLLYVEKGFTAPHKTKSGADATDGSALLTLAGIDPLSPGKYVASDPSLQYLANIAKRKNLAAVHNGFISTYMDDYLQPDGRIHALYNQFGTSTFRLSSSEPNLQNIPRAFGVKQCFNARPGFVFMSTDMSSAEVKLLASICKDERMLKAIAEGLDFHSFSASAIYNIPYEIFVAVVENRSDPKHKEYKGLRQGAKATTFGIDLRYHVIVI